MPLLTSWVMWPGSKHFHQSINLDPAPKQAYDVHQLRRELMTIPSDQIFNTSRLDVTSQILRLEQKTFSCLETFLTGQEMPDLLSGETNQLNWVSREDHRPVQFPQVIPVYGHLLMNSKYKDCNMKKRWLYCTVFPVAQRDLRYRKKAKPRNAN